MHDTIKKLRLCQSKTDFASAKKIIDSTQNLSGFNEKPWIYEIEANRIACKVFEEKKYEEAIKDAKQLLQKIDKKYLSSIYVANIYVILSTAYQIIGDIENAKKITSKTYDIIHNKFNFNDYYHVIVTVVLNLLSLNYLTGEFDQAINCGKELEDYHYKNNLTARIHFTYAFLAFSYYKTQEYEKAFSYFNKTILILMTYFQPVDVHYISSQDIFDIMLKDERINQAIVCEFKKVYNINN